MIKHNGMVLMTEEEYEQLVKKEVKVNRQQFITLWNAEEVKMFHDLESAVYGKCVTVHWNGYYCNCGDGACVSNNIIPAIKDTDEELEDTDWEED